MYVCNCTGIGEKKLEKIIDEDGARTTGQVFKTHGQSAQCGQCASDIRDILTDGPKSGATAKEAIEKWKRRKLGIDRASNDKTRDTPSPEANQNGAKPAPDLKKSPVWPSCPARSPGGR